MTGTESDPRASPNVQVECYRFEDDGIFPNNAQLAALVYRGALSELWHSPSGFEALFAANDWPPDWRSGVFDFHHYHSTAHEVLGVYAGHGQVRLGGPSLGEHLTLGPGDVLVIPAGVAHADEGSSADFRVVGAYPRGQQWDMKYGKSRERPAAERNIERTPVPQSDPLYGPDGPLLHHWTSPT